MTLLANDNFSNTLDLGHLFLPSKKFLGIGSRLLARQIILLAVDEQNHIGVLFDGTGFP